MSAATLSAFVTKIAADLMNLCYAVRDGAPGEARDHASAIAERIEAALPGEPEREEADVPWTNRPDLEPTFPAPVEEREGRYEVRQFKDPRSYGVFDRNALEFLPDGRKEHAERIAAALNAHAQDGEDGDLFRQHTALIGELLYLFDLHGDMPDAGGELLRRVRALKDGEAEGSRREVSASEAAQAVEALEFIGVCEGDCCIGWRRLRDAVQRVFAPPVGEREAEPVAWAWRYPHEFETTRITRPREFVPSTAVDVRPLYAAPAGVSEEVREAAIQVHEEIGWWNEPSRDDDVVDRNVRVGTLRRLRAALDRQPAPPALSEEVRVDGAHLIAMERRRQIEAEGWTPEHDDGHRNGALAVVAAALAVDGTDARVEDIAGRVDEDGDEWGLIRKYGYQGTKPNEIACLSIAGALLAAEIDRRLRLAALERKAGGEGVDRD